MSTAIPVFALVGGFAGLYLGARLLMAWVPLPVKILGGAILAVSAGFLLMLGGPVSWLFGFFVLLLAEAAHDGKLTSPPPRHTRSPALGED
jgi:hypothetical protein